MPTYGNGRPPSFTHLLQLTGLSSSVEHRCLDPKLFGIEKPHTSVNSSGGPFSLEDVGLPFGSCGMD
jgi:hypothetical protein